MHILTRHVKQSVVCVSLIVTNRNWMRRICLLQNWMLTDLICVCACLTGVVPATKRTPIWKCGWAFPLRPLTSPVKWVSRCWVQRQRSGGQLARSRTRWHYRTLLQNKHSHNAVTWKSISLPICAACTFALRVHVCECKCVCLRVCVLERESKVIPLNLFSCSDPYFRAWRQYGQQLSVKDAWPRQHRGYKESRNTAWPLTSAQWMSHTLFIEELGRK